MASKNHKKRKKRKGQLPKHPVRIMGHSLSIGVACKHCMKFRVGTCDATHRHTERYGFLKLRKRVVETNIAFCSNGILDVKYARDYYDKHGDLPPHMKDGIFR